MKTKREKSVKTTFFGILGIDQLETQDPIRSKPGEDEADDLKVGEAPKIKNMIS